MRFRLSSVALATVAAGMLVSAAPRAPKVLVLYDMEGVSEATSVKHTGYDSPEYPRGPRVADRGCERGHRGPQGRGRGGNRRR